MGVARVGEGGAWGNGCRRSLTSSLAGGCGVIGWSIRYFGAHEAKLARPSLSEGFVSVIDTGRQEHHGATGLDSILTASRHVLLSRASYSGLAITRLVMALLSHSRRFLHSKGHTDA